MIICPICGGDLAKDDDSLLCRRCNASYGMDGGIYRLLPLQSQQVENFFPKGSLDEMYAYEEKHFWHRARKEIIKSLMEKYVPKSSNVLEVGCGNGNISFFLKKNGWMVDCADIFESGLQNARQRSGEGGYYQLNLYDRVFEHEYACVCAFDVIEHLDDDVLALRNMHDALTSGGIALVTVPANMRLWSENDVFANHKRRYSSIELRRKMETSGFKVLKTSYFNTLLFPPILLYRRVNKVRKNHSHPGLATQIKINPYLNEMLYRIFHLETYMLPAVDMPAGVSIICVAKNE